jgi:hypothetical protein
MFELSDDKYENNNMNIYGINNNNSSSSFYISQSASLLLMFDDLSYLNPFCFYESVVNANNAKNILI